jgi:outer membrane biosynthesis protein TonB
MRIPAATTDDEGLKNSLIGSAVLHLTALLFLYFGLPHLMPPPPEHHELLSFQIVEIADMTSTRVKEEPPAPKPPAPEPPKPQVKPEQAVTPPTPEVAKPLPQVEALKAAPVPKPKPPEPKPVAEDFNKLLKNLEAKKPDTPKPAETKPDSKAQPTQQAAVPQLSEVETRTLQDAIRSQIMHCWNMPIGARDAQNLIVELGIDVNPDGTVVNTEIVDKGRYASDSFFRAATDSAVRATHDPRCTPLQLPGDKYQTWKHINFIFDPRDMI